MSVREFPSRLATLKEAAARYKVSQDTLRRRIRSGELSAYKLGSQIVRIDLDEADALFLSGSTSRSTPAEYVASLFHRMGVEADADRMNDGLLAEKEHGQAHDKDHLATVRALASMVWRTRRGAEVAARCLRIEDTADTRQVAREAVQLRQEAEDALLRACLQDRDLFNSVVFETRP